MALIMIRFGRLFASSQENQRRQIILMLLLVSLAAMGAQRSPTAVRLEPANTTAGYLARLLVNEASFPGERGWRSEKDSRAAMLSILWVLQSRIEYIPAGYSREQVAATCSSNIIDIITVGGKKGQCDGFYKNAKGEAVAVPRVYERIDYLLKIANEGKPGKFARLLEYAEGLANAYVQGGIEEADRFAGLSFIGDCAVTGRAYSWMTDNDYYKPGGCFMRIPDFYDGALGGNRFFTLEKQ